MPRPRPAAFVLKAPIADPAAACFAFARQKTMYDGKAIAPGDAVFLFASEPAGGRGLVAEGVVTHVSAVAPTPGIARQTPRVSVVIAPVATAHHALGGRELRPFTDWTDGRPETELNFKLYRQATDKIVGVSAEVAAFLRRHLWSGFEAGGTTCRLGNRDKTIS